MKITFIKVAMFEGKGADALKPVFFEIMCTLLPQNAQAVFIDDRKEKLPDDIDSDIIVLSFDTFSAKRAYELALKYKKIDNLILMGGFHPTVCIEEALEYCDTVMCGDAEGTFPQFFIDYENNNVKPIYDGRNKNAHQACLYKNKTNPYKKRYLPLGLVQFSRGCKFNCDFCSVKTMYPGKIQQKSTDEIVNEIKIMKEKLLFFIDDNIFSSEASAKELFNAIKPLKRKWVCQISIDIVQNDALLKLMQESGCVCVLIGFETLNLNNLKTMGKSANLKIENYENAIKKLYAHKFMIYATFVIGYDEDDEFSADNILNFALKNNLSVANFNPLIPLPGTPLYERLKNQNRLLYDNKWWLSDNYCYGDTAFSPKKMSAEQLKQTCKNARYKFYSFKSILKRLFAIHLKMGPFKAWYFLLINIISGVEIRRKQGALLGGKKQN